MDGLSSAASVIAVIQLAGSIVKICGGYVQDVKDAKDEIITLQQQIAGLAEVLERLVELIQGPNGKQLLTSQRLASNIVDCRATLTALEKRIDLGMGENEMNRFGRRAFKWPLKRSEAEKSMREISRYKLSFTLSLAIDQRYRLPLS